jgi:pantoate--beta-alanine ligase
MARDLDFPVEIVACPTVREADGLAMSSRNVHLSPAQREAARSISRALLDAKRRIEAGERDAQGLAGRVAEAILAGGARPEIDYVAVADAETLEDLREIAAPAVVAVAVYYGRTRLIDNVTASPPAEAD